MKKANSRADDDLRPEYDFSTLKGGVRNKYASRFQAGSVMVVLEPDLAAAFPTTEAVNEALRTVVRASRALKRATPHNKRTSTRSTPARRRGSRS